MIYLKNITTLLGKRPDPSKKKKKKVDICWIPHYKENHNDQDDLFELKMGKLKKKNVSKEKDSNVSKPSKPLKTLQKSDHCWTLSHETTTLEIFELKMGRLKKKMSSLLNLLEEDSDEARSLQDEFEHLKSSLFSEIVQISWEATPSCDVDVMQYILEADYQEQKRYLEAILKVLETDGEGDIISRKLGLNTRKMLLGHSAWQGKVGAGAQTFAEVDVERDGMNVDVMDNHKRLLNTYSAIMGYLLRQDAVIWYFKNHNLPLCEEQVGIEAKFHLGLNDKEFSEAYNAIYLEFQTWNLAPGFTNDGFIVVNYDENINNDQFHQGMQKVFSKLKKNGIGNGMRKKKVFKFIGEYISNDWISYRNGEKYFDVVQDQMLWDWVVGIRNSRIDAVNTEFQERRDKEKLLHQ